MAFEKIDVCMVQLAKGQVFVDRELFELLKAYTLEDRVIFCRFLVPFIGNAPSNPVSLQKVSPQYAQYKKEKKHMSKLNILLKQQEDCNCQILAKLSALEDRVMQESSEQIHGICTMQGQLNVMSAQLSEIQKHLTSHRVVSEKGEVPEVPPVPRRMSEYMVELMDEPVEVRAKVHQYARVKAHGIPVPLNEYYEEHIQKYDVPEFMELLQEIPFRAIV